MLKILGRNLGENMNAIALTLIIFGTMHFTSAHAATCIKRLPPEVARTIDRRNFYYPVSNMALPDGTSGMTLNVPREGIVKILRTCVGKRSKYDEPALLAFVRVEGPGSSYGDAPQGTTGWVALGLLTLERYGVSPWRDIGPN